MSRTHTLYASLAALALLTAPDTNQAECGSVAESYKAAAAAVAKALGSYATCVAESNQHDNCAAEMQALDDAHDNFVDAIGDAKACQ